jgi:hypothetical protein
VGVDLLEGAFQTIGEAGTWEEFNRALGRQVVPRGTTCQPHGRESVGFEQARNHWFAEQTIGPRHTKDPRSVEYAWQTVALLRLGYQSSQVLLERFQENLAEAERHEIYKRVPPGQPYGSLDALLVAELGVTREESIHSKAERLAADKGVQRSPANGEIGRGRNSSDNVRPNEGHGNSAAYLVRRLKRDHKDIADALARGQYRSARAAGIAAGIVKVPARLEVAKKACRKLSAKERAELRRWLDRGADHDG